MAACLCSTLKEDIMDITRLFDIAFLKPEAERERFLAEIPKTLYIPDFEDQLLLYLFHNATQMACEEGLRLLTGQDMPSSHQEMPCDTFQSTSHPLHSAYICNQQRQAQA